MQLGRSLRRSKCRNKLLTNDWHEDARLIVQTSFHLPFSLRSRYLCFKINRVSICLFRIFYFKEESIYWENTPIYISWSTKWMIEWRSWVQSNEICHICTYVDALTITEISESKRRFTKYLIIIIYQAILHKTFISTKNHTPQYRYQ